MSPAACEEGQAPPGTPAMIGLYGVTKSFYGRRAVSGLSLSIERGSIHGLLGPNGSGKTTTLRMMLNILLPDEGRIEILGQRLTRRTRDRIGYMPEERGLYKKSRVRDMLAYLGELKGRSRKESAADIDRWLARFDLSDYAARPVEALSKGMAQKVQLVGVLVGRPELLVLDEPFSGLDPVSLTAMREVILELRQQGLTIVLSTHDMPSAETMCDRVTMMSRGEKVLDGTLEQIQRSFAVDVVRIEVEHPRVLAEMPQVLAAEVEEASGGRRLRVRVRGDHQVFLRALMDKTAVHRFEIARPSLFDIFVRMAKPRTDAPSGTGTRALTAMQRAWAVARFEFSTVVRSKAFIVGVLVVPLLLAVSALFPAFLEAHSGKAERRFAVVDWTRVLYEPLAQAARQRDEDGSPGERYVPAAVPLDAAPDDIRRKLADRVRSGELFAFVEIPAEILDAEVSAEPSVRYYSEHATYDELRRFVADALSEAVRARRFANAALDRELVRKLSSPIVTEHFQLPARDVVTSGAPAERVDETRAFAIPTALMFLLFLVSTSTSARLITSVVEEKMTRIGEVLLGLSLPSSSSVSCSARCCSPSSLESSTSASPRRSQRSWDTLISFPRCRLPTSSSSSRSMCSCSARSHDHWRRLHRHQGYAEPDASGDAGPHDSGPRCSGGARGHPSSPFAVLLSFVPLTMPTTMLLRVAITPAPPFWQVLVSTALAIAATVLAVVAAGRVLRTGLLMQGKSATLKEIAAGSFRT